MEATVKNESTEEEKEEKEEEEEALPFLIRLLPGEERNGAKILLIHS